MNVDNKYLEIALHLTHGENTQYSNQQQIKELKSIVNLYMAEYKKLKHYFHDNYLPEHWYGVKNVHDTIEVLNDRAHWTLIYMTICAAIKKTENLICHTDNINFEQTSVKEQIHSCTEKIMGGNDVNKSVIELLTNNRSLFYQLEPLDERNVQFLYGAVCEQLEKYDTINNTPIVFR
jgi:hypothetical protein